MRLHIMRLYFVSTLKQLYLSTKGMQLNFYLSTKGMQHNFVKSIFIGFWAMVQRSYIVSGGIRVRIPQELDVVAFWYWNLNVVVF